MTTTLEETAESLSRFLEYLLLSWAHTDTRKRLGKTYLHFSHKELPDVQLFLNQVDNRVMLVVPEKARCAAANAASTQELETLQQEHAEYVKELRVHLA